MRRKGKPPHPDALPQGERESCRRGGFRGRTRSSEQEQITDSCGDILTELTSRLSRALGDGLVAEVGDSAGVLGQFAFREAESGAGVQGGLNIVVAKGMAEHDHTKVRKRSRF